MNHVERLEQFLWHAIIFFMVTNDQLRTAAVEDYCKAIFALRIARRSAGVDERAGGAPGDHARLGAGDAEAPRRTRDRSATCPIAACASPPTGRRVALEVIRHHRLLEGYLADALGMPWDRVHAEAEVLEHVLSDDLEELIAAKLGHPTVDPHGDPIPNADLEIEERATDRMESLQARGRGLLRARIRLRPRDAALPRRARHLPPATASRCVDRQPFGGPCSCSSASASTRSAASSPAPCVSRRERASARARPAARAHAVSTREGACPSHSWVNRR